MFKNFIKAKEMERGKGNGGPSGKLLLVKGKRFSRAARHPGFAMLSMMPKKDSRTSSSSEISSMMPVENPMLAVMVRAFTCSQKASITTNQFVNRDSRDSTVFNLPDLHHSKLHFKLELVFYWMLDYTSGERE